MRVLPLKEVLALGPGEAVPAFKAQIKEIKDFHSGQNQIGPWSIQKMTLMDGTGLLKIKVFDKPEFTKAWVGHWVYFESKPNEKGEPRGMKIVDEEYRGRTTRMVEVRSDATITQAEAGKTAPDFSPAGAPAAPQAHPVMPPPQSTAPEPATQAAPPPRAAAPPPVHSPQQPAALPPSDKPKHPINVVRESLGRSAVGLVYCFDAAVYVKKHVEKRHAEDGIKLSNEDVRTLAIHLSIGLEKSFKLDNLPVKLPEEQKPNETKPT